MIHPDQDYLQKSRFKKLVEVHRKDGTSFERFQMVGSDKNYQTKHFNLNKRFDDPAKQKRYDQHLMDLHKLESEQEGGGYVKVVPAVHYMRDGGGRSNASTRNTSSDSMREIYDTPIDYPLSEAEERYREHLLQQRKEEIGAEKFNAEQEAKRKKYDETKWINAYSIGDPVDPEFYSAQDRTKEKQLSNDELHELHNTRRGQKLKQEADEKSKKEGIVREKSIIDTRYKRVKNDLNRLQDMDLTKVSYGDLKNELRSLRMFLITLGNNKQNTYFKNTSNVSIELPNGTQHSGNLIKLMQFINEKAQSEPKDKPKFAKIIFTPPTEGIKKGLQNDFELILKSL